MTDPFAVLGLPPDADEQQVRAARRRLAKARHPDAGGDDAGMASLNDAAEQALRSIAEGRPPTEIRDDRASPPHASGGANTSPDASPRGRGRVTTDMPSFTIEALPAEAFEALLVVASWIGEVLDDDPPYRLEVTLNEPGECWCALDLVPDAGASTVSLQVASIGNRPAPDVEAVRDVWIAHLNQLDWS
jgi:hypothetical protein